MSTFIKFNGKSLRVGQTVTADVVGAAFRYKSFIWTNDDPIIIGVMDIKKTYVQSDEVKTTASDGELLYDTFIRDDLVSLWIYAGRCRKGGRKNEDFRIAPYIYIASPYHSEDEEELFFNSRLALAACRDYMVNQGAKKYGERNWERGLPESSYLDSSVRHYLKWKAGWTDEPHYTACLWNLVALWWTHDNITEKESEETE